MTSPPRDDIFDIAAKMGLPVPDAYRAGVANTLVSLMEQAALVMSAPTLEGDDGALDFAP
jgi:hypothetical protein